METTGCTRSGRPPVAVADRAKNEVGVTSSKSAPGLCVLLGDGLVDTTGEVAVFRGVPQRSLAVVLSTAALGDAALACAIRVPLGG